MYFKMSSSEPQPQGITFLELRKKIQDAEVLSSSVERLLKSLGFTGRLTVVVQNGRVLKSGYEEGYFTRRWDDRSV
jgi:sulfur carrier protein ThiS